MREYDILDSLAKAKQWENKGTYYRFVTRDIVCVVELENIGPIKNGNIYICAGWPEVMPKVGRDTSFSCAQYTNAEELWRYIENFIDYVDREASIYRDVIEPAAIDWKDKNVIDNAKMK